MGAMADSPVPDGDARAGPGHRRVHLSTPGAPSPASWTTKFGQLARKVYIGLRDDALDPEVTFDLACFLMDWGSSSPAVHELAEQSAAGTDPVRLAVLARQVLEESGFQPDFDTEPRLLAELEEALAAVKADMGATGLAGQVRLAFEDEGDSYLRNVFADFRGSFSHTGGVSPSDARDRMRALLAVADDVQDAIMGSLMAVWPVCPDHDLGGHPREHDSEAVWWCNGGGSGHAIAPIGHWIGDVDALRRGAG
jgi:hypothetical protein